MDEQKNGRTIPQRPTTDDRDEWAAYWRACGLPWRTDPEILEERQEQLEKWQTAKYSTRGDADSFDSENERLNRADIEWLLATHQSDGFVGPVDWNDENQRQRLGLDVNFANMRGIDLTGLPLAHLSAVRTNLAEARLEGTCLVGADFAYANLQGAQFNSSTLLLEARFGNQRGDVYARVMGKRGLSLALAVILSSLYDFTFAYTTAVLLIGVVGAIVYFAGVKFGLVDPNLNINLASGPYSAIAAAVIVFTGVLVLARLVVDDKYKPGNLPIKYSSIDELIIVLRRALRHSPLSKYLTTASFRPDQRSGALLADARWNGANLAVVDWQRMRISGEESRARMSYNAAYRRKTWEQRLAEYELAVRGYRQLSVLLRSQGLNEGADLFAYRAQEMQRQVLLRQYKPVRWLGSLFLALISGYGYRPLRSFITYLIIIGAFAGIYALLAHAGLTREHFGSWDSPIVLSVTSFHGRVFFAGGLELTDWAARVGAVEAVVGLLIEITFIATFTQRFFAR